MKRLIDEVLTELEAGADIEMVSVKYSIPIKREYEGRNITICSLVNPEDGKRSRIACMKMSGRWYPAGEVEKEV